MSQNQIRKQVPSYVIIIFLLMYETMNRCQNEPIKEINLSSQTEWRHEEN